MKQHLEQLVQAALKTLEKQGELPAISAHVQLEMTKDNQYGDYASNIALILAKSAQKKPRDIAEGIVKALPVSSFLKKVEVAGPGFINFFLSPEALTGVVTQVLAEKENFGCSKMGRSKKVLIEFLSSNPTGPLHVGHGRHAAFGAVIGNLLSAVGFKVYREYYVNDAGRQMDILAVSVWLRYLELCGQKIQFPTNGYQGEYVRNIAKALKLKHQAEFCQPTDEVLANLPADEPDGGDKERYIDAIIARAKSLLGDKYQPVFEISLEKIMTDIRNDMHEFGINYDNWFSERAFVNAGEVDKVIAKLQASGHVYEKEGAKWFRATDFGDTKDRVLERSNGQRTYFANDVAYHINKFERGFDLCIDILGSDHHGYLDRIKASLEAVQINPERLIYILVQFVSLYRGNTQIAMSTRGGNFVTLRELRNEVGNDAARFFYVMRKSEQPMDFDLELAKSQSNENPVYYVQYAFARINSVFKQLKERGIVFDEANGIANLSLLIEPQERELLNTMTRYPDVIVNAALQYEPHLLTHYLRELAGNFHTYYNSHQFIVDNQELRDARLVLLVAIQQILANAFSLLGVTPLASM